MVVNNLEALSLSQTEEGPQRTLNGGLGFTGERRECRRTRVEITLR